ncbi:P-loop containing nucleoside triphosphate hydrolase protein [Phascolomyces articulosus]|uniref:P-loop containing nucleoside triphosphate hydrolase protein n=1 Tax=Phascolomyces articulosus TaxID=60185 RepID=A0AAD5KBK6_9FUNG|nr:P-loop containing nucleoside triphosphate hydrolase protein [Phascolomyces articulosus]
MPSTQVTQALDIYTDGIKAWFPDDEAGWVSASLISKNVTDTHVKIVFSNDTDESREHVFEATVAELEKTNANNLPPLRNPPKMEAEDDLTNLSHLNEPSVLHTIKIRYGKRQIYTYSGIVLIATNPFDRVRLYEPDIIQQYSGRRRGELEPHLFAIAEDAYRCMIREQSNQTIIVSGESGAGKTVSAKYIMRYFATADDKETVGKKAKNGAGAMTEVEEQILATNPIMEAFGNAKTTRNDNSSRFGKYIEIQFDKQCNIVGAKIRTYLLERSRLIFQPETERNYHIFYQFCAGASPEERQKLDLQEWSNFHYLKQGGTGEIPGVDDTAEFDITKQSLSMVGITDDTQQQIFRLLAALLHLGNIEIGGRTDAMLSENDASLGMATQLLGINTNEFKKWIVRKQISTRSEKIMTNLSPQQALVVRDSMAKYIYSNLFDWLVGVVNESLACVDAERVSTFIGVLDIYGFEHFKKNSFEQFCINYANEKLQQQFNQHVFKLEQEEYVRENIDWTFIDFSDNQKCIEMIEAKMGILSLLDEESRLPSGSDQGFCNKLYNNFGTSAYQNYFKKPRFSNNAFTVVHYAHDVQYESEGFMEKNKDTVPDEHLALLENAEFEFLAGMIKRANAASSPSPSNSIGDSPTKRPGASKLNAPKKPTLGSMFKISLINLMDTIGQTNVHYIRCIKPNEAKVAWAFEPNMVLAQLRACGVLETIRISCAGYPSRWTFEEFAERYYALVDAKHWYPKTEKDIRTLCSTVVDTYIQDPDKYQIGLTKIFFRAGQLAYMEKLRTDRWTEVAIFLQKNARRFIARRRYLRVLKLVTQLQQVVRRKIGQAQLERLRREKAATTIQKYWRCYAARKWYLKQRAIIIQIQAASRALIAKKRFSMIREHNAATQIQKIVRGWSARKKYQATRNHIIRIQTCIRRRNARKQLVVMRAEARSVSHFKEVSYKLETKVVELTQNLAQQKEDKARLKNKASELETQVKSWITKYDSLDDKAKSLNTVIDKTGPDSDHWSSLQQQRDGLKSEYMTSLNKIKTQDKEIARLTEELSRQKEEIAQLRKASQETVEKPMEDADMSELKSQIAALKAQLSQTLGHSRRQQQQKQPKATPYRGRRATAAMRRKSSTTIEQPIAASTNMSSCQPDDPLYTLFQDEDLLQVDVLEGLIRELSIVSSDVSNPPSSKEKTYPAHVIGYCVIQMWKRGYLVESEQWLFAIMEAIEKKCLDLVGEPTTETCAYWLINAHELLSVISASESDIERSAKQSESDSRWHEIEKIAASMKYELQYVQDGIYNHCVSELKKQLQRVVVPAIVESQSLPGFISNSGTTSSLMPGQATPIAMDDLLAILNKAYEAMQGYEMNPLVTEQVMNELLKYIQVTAFNDLIMRRNFNSWKRAMQIQHNITVLENWCKSRNITDATLQLEHLSQATKLLQLKKATVDDIKIIYDVCWILSPPQVHKLVQSYSVAEYEDPINHDVMRAAASRITDKKEVLLSSVPIDESIYEVPAPYPDATADTYLPKDLKLDRLQQFMKAIAS